MPAPLHLPLSLTKSFRRAVTALRPTMAWSLAPMRPDAGASTTLAFSRGGRVTFEISVYDPTRGRLNIRRKDERGSGAA
jgi:hypothetical protein